MKDKIHEGWHETDFNKLQFVRSIKKEVFDDIDKNKKISGYILEPDKKLIHMSERTYEELKEKHLGND